MATKDIVVVDENGNEDTVTFYTQNVQIVYDDESVVDPFIVRDIERNSDRKKTEATSVCGNRQVADDGDGKVEYTIECYIDRQTRNVIHRKKGATGKLFSDLTEATSVDAFIKKDAIALSNDMNSVLINGQETQLFDCQLTVIEE
jgi:hypothetical protein